MNAGLVEIPGLRLNVRTNVPWQDLEVATNIITNDEYGLKEMLHSIPTPKVILDIGGHIGTFGIFAKTLWPTATLIAVEPSIDNATLYEMNLKSNNLFSDKTIVINAAVNYESDRNTLVRSSRTSGGCILMDKNTANQYVMENYRKMDGLQRENVPSVTIEDIIRDYKIETIDLAKFDCEGSEQQIFKNMAQESADKFRFIVGEYHYWADGLKILKRSPHGEFKYWRETKKKFKHLDFAVSEINKQVGVFKAWPKEK